MELWRKIYFKIFTVYTGTSLQKKKKHTTWPITCCVTSREKDNMEVC